MYENVLRMAVLVCFVNAVESSTKIKNGNV